MRRTASRGDKQTIGQPKQRSGLAPRSAISKDRVDCLADEVVLSLFST